MNDSFGPGFDTSEVKSEARAEGVVSLFVSQVHRLKDEGVKIWGKTYGIISLVGIVRKIDYSSTKITYLVEDHTGQIEAHLWVDDSDTLAAPNVRLNSYARVHGSVRRQGEIKVIMIYKIAPLESIKELNTHMLEVLHCRYKTEAKFKKSEAISANGGGGSISSGFGFGDNTSISASSFGLSGKNLLVYQAIKSYNQPDGIPRHVLQSKFAHISTQEFQTIMDFLFQEGHVFTSIDADHFLSTE